MSTPQGGYYPQEAYYAPGWQQPVAPPPPRRPWGRILVVALVGLVVLALAGGGVAWLLQVRATSTVGEVTSARTVNARQLDVGHCIEELPQDGDVASVRLVPCADPHAAEVLGTRTFEDGAWPGARAVQRETEATCEMDTAQADLGLVPVVWTPTEASWGQGDRTGLCLAWLPDGTVRGSWTAGDDVG